MLDNYEAFKWYKLSAVQGNVNGQFLLGSMYGSGKGVPQDYNEAVKWYRMSAAQGNKFARSNIGYMYANGHGVYKDYILSYK